MRKSHALIAILLLCISLAHGQSLFIEQSIAIPANSVIEWGDYDSDGDQDLLYVAGGAINLQNNTLTGTTASFSNSAITFPAYVYTTFGWFDINRDGYLDIYAITDSGIKFFISNKAISFIEVTPNFNYTPSNIFDWGDMDNDGLLDLFSGDIFINRGNYEFERKTVLNLQSGEFFDYDSDGDLDVFSDDRVFQNLGSYVFDLFKYFNVDIANSGRSLFDMKGSMLLDVNADGKPEYVGMRGSGNYLGCQYADFRVISDNPPVVKPFSFSLCFLFNFLNAADYNHDGLIEYLIQQVPSTDFGAGNLTVYSTNAAGDMVVRFSQGFDGSGPARTVDVNNDGKPDLSIGGRLLVNGTTSTNAKPSAPASLTPVVNGNSVAINWSKGSDDRTSPNSLTYNLVVARGPEFSYNDGVSSTLRVNKNGIGNSGYSQTHVLKGLPKGIYQCMVQSIDQGLQSSSFSSAETFEITEGDDAVSETHISGTYKTVFSKEANQYLVAYAQGGSLFGEFLDGPTMQRLGEPFIINNTSGATEKFNIGFHSFGNVYVVTWSVGNKLYGKAIQPSDLTGAGAEKLLYTAATPVDLFHMVGKNLLYSETHRKVFLPWIERRGTEITLKTTYLTAALNTDNPTTKVFNILQGEIYPSGETSETIPLTFESDIDFVTSKKLYALAWTFNGEFFVPCPTGCARGLVSGNYLLESLREDGTWLTTSTVVPARVTTPSIKYNPFNDNLLCVYGDYRQDYSRDTGLQQYREVKARLISLASTGLISYDSPTIDVSVSTPPLSNHGNELPTLAWSSKRNEFIVGWNKTTFSGGDNFLYYQRINSFTGALIEPAQIILTTERGHDTRLDYNSVTGDFLLGWLGEGRGNFKRFSTYKDTKPVVSQLSQTKAYAGTKIAITGLNFGKTPYINSVMFGDIPAQIDTLFFDPTKLQVTVPPGLARRIVPVTVTFDDQTSNASVLFENISSTSVTSVAPLVGVPGEIITITGTNFPDEENLVQVTFGSITTEPADVVSSTATKIEVKVPQDAIRGSNQVVSVVIQGIANFGTSNFRVKRIPLILTVTPIGDPEFTSTRDVRIVGDDFSDNVSDLVIKFGTVVIPLEYIELPTTNTVLNVRVPLGAEGTLKVFVFADDTVGVSPLAYPVFLGSAIKDKPQPTEFALHKDADDKIPFEVEVYNRNSVEAVNFKSKGLSSPDEWTSRSMTDPVAGNKISFDMSEAEFTDDPIGLEAYYEVVDLSGIKKESKKFTIYKNFVDSANVIPELRFGGNVADYNIIAIPYELQINKIPIVFKDLFDEYGSDITKWRISHYEPSTGNYSEYLKGLDDVEPGKGYWLISRYPKDIFFDGANTVNVDKGYYPITLQNGWNQIGNPYNFNVSWQDVMTFNNDTTVIESFKTFKDGTFQMAETIEKFRGGFVRYNGPGTFELKIPAKQNKDVNGGRTQQNKRFISNLDGKEWRLALELTAGNLKNTLSSFGMHPQSLDGEDDRDEHRLPAFIETLDVAFPGSLSTSMVTTSDHHSWDFEVLNTTGAEDVTLQWDNTSFGSGDLQLFLHDKVAERLIDMRAQNSYTFAYRPNHPFVIHFGDADYITENSRPGHMTLATAYPNPMSETTNIAFSLSRAYPDVRLTVYDLQGREIKTLVQNPLEAGFYEVAWEGNDTNGNLLPDGLWIYRLQVSNGKNVESATGKVILKR